MPHRHILVNGRTVDIPSYRVGAHDEVGVAEASRDLAAVRAALEGAARGAPVTWLAVDSGHAVGKVTELPTREAIPVAAQEQRDYDAAFDLLKQGHYEGAAKGFRDFLSKYPQSTLRDNAQYISNPQTSP